MNSTPSVQIGLSEESRKPVIELLTKVLANTVVLSMKTQVSHWNVTDDRFYSLHEMFEKQYEMLSEATDETAERIRALSEKTPLGLKALMEHSTIAEYTTDHTGEQMIQSLLSDHELMCREIREGIRMAAQAGDDGSADFLTGRLKDHEKISWMLRSSRGGV